MSVSPALFASIDVDLNECFPLRGTSLFAADLLRSNVLKKFVESESPFAIDRARERFSLANDRCASFCVSSLDSLPSSLIDCVKFHLSKFELDFEPSLDGCKFGPGASNGVRGSDFVSKVSSSLTATNAWLYGLYISTIAPSPAWLSAERKRRERTKPVKIVPGSKVSFVPKNSETRRAICVEPSLNMFFQQGICFELTKRLAAVFSIDLEDQQFRNRRLARAGSIDGSYSTIDLSSASDTISLTLCRHILPPLLMEWLETVRSPTATLDNGVVVDLAMISSMGNATTFPLETMIFCAVVWACYDLLGIPCRRNSLDRDANFGVFGDDIIVDSKATSLVLRALEAFGFAVNTEKTFYSGSFRESCGGDYYQGRNVRPVYISKLDSDSDIYVSINMLTIWSSRHGIPLLNSISFLRSLLRGPVYFVPLWEQIDSGVRTPAVGSRYKCLKTHNRQFNVETTRLPAFNLVSNGESIYLGFLQGSIRNMRLSVRGRDVVRVRRSRAVNPAYCDRSTPLLEDVYDETYRYVASLTGETCASLGLLGPS